MDHENEIRSALRREAWSIKGLNRIVKVVPLYTRSGAVNPLVATVRGYVCLEKVLLGKTPFQLDAVLGMHNALTAGIRVYRLLRLPVSQEVEYELTAQYPGGQVYSPVMHDPDYPPGSSAVHQWKLLAEIPVSHLRDVRQGERYPYEYHP